MQLLKLTSKISMFMVLCAIFVFVVGGTIAIVSNKDLFYYVFLICIGLIMLSIPVTLVCLCLALQKGMITIGYFFFSIVLSLFSVGLWYFGVVFLLRKDVKDFTNEAVTSARQNQ
jgi:hypothetical protein